MPVNERWLAGVFALVLAGCSGCSESGESPSHGSDASSGGTAGVGGAGAGGSTGGGAGYTGDASSDAASPAPSWEAIPGSVHGCSLERLVNPDEFQLFSWQPCAGSQACEQALFNPAVWLDTGSEAVQSTILPGSNVSDDGAAVRATLLIYRHGAAQTIFVVNDDGTALEGFRVSADCAASEASLWAGRLGLLISPNASAKPEDLAVGLHEVGDQPLTILDFPQEPIGVPQDAAIGNSRWVMEWVPAHRLVSVSNVDASDLRVVAASQPSTGTILELGWPVSTGDHFLFHQWVKDSSGSHYEIAITDGLVQASPFIVPPEGSDYAHAQFAHSHVGWARGVSRKIDHSYDAVEIWASPWSAEQNKLQPKKIADFPAQALPAYPGGGWGYYAAYVKQDEVRIYDLDSAAQISRRTPTGAKFWRTFGMTRSHLWAGATNVSNDNRGDRLIRVTNK